MREFESLFQSLLNTLSSNSTVTPKLASFLRSLATDFNTEKETSVYRPVDPIALSLLLAWVYYLFHPKLQGASILMQALVDWQKEKTKSPRINWEKCGTAIPDDMEANMIAVQTQREQEITLIKMLLAKVDESPISNENMEDNKTLVQDLYKVAKKSKVLEDLCSYESINLFIVLLWEFLFEFLTDPNFALEYDIDTNYPPIVLLLLNSKHKDVEVYKTKLNQWKKYFERASKGSRHNFPNSHSVHITLCGGCDCHMPHLPPLNVDSSHEMFEGTNMSVDHLGVCLQWLLINAMKPDDVAHLHQSAPAAANSTMIPNPLIRNGKKRKR
jgi:hypothetical protein